MKRRKENEGGDSGSGGGFTGAAPEKKQKEVDEHKIGMRMKQIQFGYNTAAYDNYSSQVVKSARNTNYNEHPRTPDPYEMQSKRAFDGRIRKWRRELHRWDPQGEIMQAPIAAVKKNEASVKAEEEKEKEAPRGTGEEELGESLEQYGDDSIFEAAIKEEESDEEDIL
jgi:histone RNA hairpin-binding protein